MCLHPHPIDPIPEETAQVARAAFPKGSFAMQVRDLVGTIYEDAAFAGVYPARGTTATSPWRLMLVTVLQYAENLTDRQAAEAVAARIDWKYALSLPLRAPGFDFSVLSDFRERVVAGDADALVLEPLLARCRELGLLRAGGTQRTDSTHVVAAIRTLNRLEVVGETMPGTRLRVSLNDLATVAPDWVRAHCPSLWVDRYGPRIQAARLAKDEAERDLLVAEIGQDGQRLLALLAEPDAPAEAVQQHAIGILRLVWRQQYEQEADGTLRWRRDAELPPPAELIVSPYDPDARYARKRETRWTGSTVHLTETCADPERPNLIVHVASTPAKTEDQEQTEAIQAEVVEADLTPERHLVDSGYVTGDILVASAERGIDLVSRVPENRQWQAREGTGFALEDFTIDWAQEQVTCPAGRVSSSWKQGVDRTGTAVITVGFATTACRSCPVRPQCTTASRRVLSLRPQAAYEALQGARARQQTAVFKRLYALRAGVEGTISQGVSVCGLRSARYLGLPKTHLQHLASAAAMNLIRLVTWYDEPEHAPPRRSPFQRAMAAA
jgi:transposase